MGQHYVRHHLAENHTLINFCLPSPHLSFKWPVLEIYKCKVSLKWTKAESMLGKILQTK